MGKRLAIRKQVLGTKHPRYGTSLANLAEIYRLMGEYNRAEPLYRQALDIYKRAVGENALAVCLHPAQPGPPSW